MWPLLFFPSGRKKGRKSKFKKTQHALIFLYSTTAKYLNPPKGGFKYLVVVETKKRHLTPRTHSLRKKRNPFGNKTPRSGVLYKLNYPQRGYEPRRDESCLLHKHKHKHKYKHRHTINKVLIH